VNGRRIPLLDKPAAVQRTSRARAKAHAPATRLWSSSSGRTGPVTASPTATLLGATSTTTRTPPPAAAGETDVLTVYDKPFCFALHNRTYGRRQLHRTGERYSLHLIVHPTPCP
jgi:hypothetical protein